MIVLIDTSILLDVVQRRAPHDTAAAQVWKLVEEGLIDGYVSAISFNNIFYIARKLVGRDAAIDAVRQVRLVFPIVPLDAGVIDAAIASSVIDFEDAIQAAAAARLGADYILSRNTKDFRGQSTPCVTAEELLGVLAPEQSDD